MADLLSEMIERYKVPPWPYEAVYDRVVVFSVPEAKATRETYVDGGLIAKPQTKMAAEKNETPRGILVSAGLGARDYLRAHGMGLGHMVWVARLSPWRHEVDRTNDGAIEFLFLRAGDVVGSETLQGYIREGKVKVTLSSEGEDRGQHRYQYLDGDVAPRFDPPSYVG